MVRSGANVVICENPYAWYQYGWAFKESQMERRLWLLKGQQVQHRSGKVSRVSEIHIWFYVTEVEARIRNRQRGLQSMSRATPGVGVHQQSGVVLDRV